ncbi:MAG: transposase [Actinobacteria bacterium]|nr:MAG: transposase [Actinomycetota bacterium]
MRTRDVPLSILPRPRGECRPSSAPRWGETRGSQSGPAASGTKFPPERFHQSLRKEFLADRSFPSLERAQVELDAWVTDYNTQRPHQALEMATPAERFRLAPISVDAASVPVDAEDDRRGQWVLRRVASNGGVI